MYPLPHRACVIARQQAAAHETAQQPRAHACERLDRLAALVPPRRGADDVYWRSEKLAASAATDAAGQ
jgi:hypothetical protein